MLEEETILKMVERSRKRVNDLDETTKELQANIKKMLEETDE